MMAKQVWRSAVEDAKNHVGVAALLAVSLVLSLASSLWLWSGPSGASDTGLALGRSGNRWNNQSQQVLRDELEAALEVASMGNKTLIITVLNKAYAEEDGMLDLFLESLRLGEGTEPLIRHILFVCVDRVALRRCRGLRLRCHRLTTVGADFSKEELYMSSGFISMMWRRTFFLGQVLRRGYSFLFTDMDVLWLRNPFTKLGDEGEDVQISCDRYNGRPFDDSNPINTGFYFAVSNNRTIRLFDEWYTARNESDGKKEQDVLSEMQAEGVFQRLGLRVRFLDVRHFAGFCRNSGGFEEVRTIHANCCRSVKAKLADLRVVLREWKAYNGTPAATLRWPQHAACNLSWKTKLTSS